MSADSGRLRGGEAQRRAERLAEAAEAEQRRGRVVVPSPFNRSVRRPPRLLLVMNGLSVVFYRAYSSRRLRVPPPVLRHLPSIEEASKCFAAVGRATPSRETYRRSLKTFYNVERLVKGYARRVALVFAAAPGDKRREWLVAKAHEARRL